MEVFKRFQIIFLSLLMLTFSFSYKIQAQDITHLNCHTPTNVAPDISTAQSLCNELIRSSVCQKVKREDIRTCEETNLAVKGWDYIKGCVSGLFDSVVDLLTFLGKIMEFVWDSVTLKKDFGKGLEYSKSALLYLDAEYQRHYEKTSSPLRTLKAMKSMAGAIAGTVIKTITNFVSAQVEQFDCLNERAQSHMVCKVMGDIFIPPAAVLALIKHGPAAIKGFKSLEKGIANAKKDMHLHLKEKAEFSKIKSVEELNELYLNYSPTTPAINQKWIDIAKSQNADLFIDVENSAIKRLNDSIGDKNLVTSLTNVQKELLFRNLNKVFAKHPNLDVAKYSDFKSSRFAINGKVTPDIQKEIEKAIRATNKEMGHRIAKLHLDKIKENENVAGWFSSGIGNNADEAGLAARESRIYSRDYGINLNPTVDFHSMEKSAQKKMDGIEVLRQKVVAEISHSPNGKRLLSESNDPSKMFLSREAMEVLRKEDATLGPVLKDKYDLVLSEETLNDMRKYYTDVDSFSPGIWTKERVVANLDDAKAGGFSADFTGMGAANIEQVAIDLAHSGGDVKRAVREVRKGEGKVTEMFEENKNFFSKHVKFTLESKGKQVTTKCSGDDCVGIMTSSLSAGEKRHLMETFVEQRNPSSIRLSFIPPGLDSGVRSKMALAGEVLEKLVRKQVTGVGAGRIPAAKMKHVLIALDMPKQIRGADVNILLGADKLGKLSKAEKSIIQDAFKGAVKKLDDNMEFDSDFAPQFNAGAVESYGVK